MPRHLPAWTGHPECQREDSLSDDAAALDAIFAARELELPSELANQLTAYWTSWAPVLKLSLRLTRCLCDSTVLMLRFKDCAVSRVLMPLPIMCRICSSRVLSRSTGFPVVNAPPAAIFLIMLLPTVSDR